MRLNGDQIAYLRSLVRMDLRKRRKRIASFAPHPGQDVHEAAGILSDMVVKLAWSEDVYRALDGDLDGMRQHGGRQEDRT
jgi:hypothetical protein